MSMRHHYDFFDRAFFDSVWTLSWKQFQKINGGRRATQTKDYLGDYFKDCLRELISFSMEPEPSPELVEDVLARRTIRWTLRHSSPQFYLMSEVMREVRGNDAHLCWVGEIRDVGIVISAALSGYFAGHIAKSVLVAVLKLHSCGNPGDWVNFTTKQRRMLVGLTSGVDMLKPIYAWQDESACGDEEWANCLGIRDTKHFVSFIARAWRENWPILELKDLPQPLDQRQDREPHFRDFQLCRDLEKATRKIARFKRPSVYRRWC